MAGWLGDQLQLLLATHVLLAIALVLFVEESGVPLPIPGDLIMLTAGVQAARGLEPLWVVIGIEEASTVAGAAVLFALTRGAGRGLIMRYGSYVGLGPDRLRAMAARVNRHASSAVFVGRLVPGLRVLTVAAAGAVDVAPIVFLPALAAGALVYLVTYTLAGYLVGPVILQTFEHVAIPVTTILSLAGLLALATVIRSLRRSWSGDLAARRSLATFMGSGSLAALAGMLAANVVVGALGVASRLAGTPIELAATDASVTLKLFLGWPGFLVIAVSLAIVYGWLALGRLRFAGRIAISGAAPLAITLLLIDPVGDASRGDLPTSTTIVLTVLSIVRWSAFALSLELLPRALRGGGAAERARRAPALVEDR
jgi:membrane-associated protein